MSSDLAQRIIGTIDAERLAEIRARWEMPHSGQERREKYLDLEKWIGINLRRVRMAGLDTGDRRRVLDLGCGAGYFLYICKLLGHDVLGIDRIERNSLYTDMRALLGVPWVGQTIRAFTPLDITGRSFDAVTAHMVCFNGHRTQAPWGVPEWEWLLDSVSAPAWHIELNAEPDGTLFTPGLREFFESRGAEIHGHRVLMRRRS